VTVTGHIPSIFFNNNVNFEIRERLQTIEQWGSQEWRFLSTAFAGCPNAKLNADDIPNLSNVSSLSAMFENCTNFEDLKDQIGNWDISTVTDIGAMFENCSLFDESLANWNISNINSMIRILINSGMSQENYDTTLIGWATLENGETQIPTNISLDVDATYCLGEDARNTLTSSTYNWEINDEGLDCVTLSNSTTEIKDNTISTYPNPVSDAFTITGFNSKNLMYKIIDISGKVIVADNYIGDTIDINHLQSGVYFLFIEQDQKVHRLKLVKD
jgi:hypothetical protein